MIVFLYSLTITMAESALALSYASFILPKNTDHSKEKFMAILSAAGVKVDETQIDAFIRSMKGDSVDNIISNITAAGCVANSVSVTPALSEGNTVTSEAPKEEDEEEDDDMGFGLFD